MTYQETVRANIGAVLHTALRKATDHDWSVPAYQAIHAMPPEIWTEVCAAIADYHSPREDALGNMILKGIEKVAEDRRDRRGNWNVRTLAYSLERLPDEEWQSVLTFVRDCLKLEGTA